MNGLIESLTGLDKMSDQIIATDFLIAAKNGVINYSIAITETTSSEIRKVLKKQLKDAVATHEAISNYMIEKGYYKPYNIDEQYKADLTAADTALKLKSGIFK